MSLDQEWLNFLNNEYSNSNNNIDNDNNDDEKIMPKCSDIYISTKTKIIYLNIPLDIYYIFWNIPIIDYNKQLEGIIKKQIKISCNNNEEVDKINKLCENSKNLHIKIISEIDNPNGRVKYKNVRKISIGICRKDLLYNKTKTKSAFYNCFVLSLRILYNNIFKEIHVKIFNTGKLEIPGIQNDDILSIVIEKIIKILTMITNNNITFNKDKTENVLINSNFNCGYYINRDKLFHILRSKYNVSTNYDPCSYPGIQCIYIDNLDNITYKLSYMIFRTGSVLIVGKCDENILYRCYNYIKNILEIEYKEIFTSKNNIIKDKNNINNSNNSNSKFKKKIIYISGTD